MPPPTTSTSGWRLKLVGRPGWSSSRSSALSKSTQTACSTVTAQLLWRAQGPPYELLQKHDGGHDCRAGCAHCDALGERHRERIRSSARLRRREELVFASHRHGDSHARA